jgi:hypothetical protein
MSLLALRNVLILRKPRNGCLEGRTALIQPIVDSFTSSVREREGSIASAMGRVRVTSPLMLAARTASA